MSEAQRPFGFLSRRRFLAAGLTGGSLLLMGGGGFLWLRGRAPAVSGLARLSDHEYRTLSLLARTHFPRGGAFEVGAEDLDLARRFDAFLSGEPEQNVSDLKSALFLLEMGPVFFERRLSTFSRLSEEARLAHWEQWMLSERDVQRQVALAFRKFLSLVFFDDPKTWAGVGYPGPSLYGMPEPAPAKEGEAQ